MNTGRTSRRGAWLAIALVIVVAAGARLYAIGEQPFWLDEAHTAEFTTLTLGELWSFDEPFDTVNPPGFILLMKAWTQLSRSDSWFRMLSALAGILTVAVIYVIGRRLAGHRGGLLAAAFLGLSGFHVRYSQEARAYALITLCAAVAMLAVLQIVDEPEGDRARMVRPGWRPIRSASPSGRRAVTWTDLAWVGYAVSTGVALHLHNTAIGIVLASNVAVAIWWVAQRPRPMGFIRNWIGAHLLMVVVFSPWIPGFIEQLGLVQQSFWVLPPTFTTIVRDLGVVFDAYTSLLWTPLGSIPFHGIVLVATLTVAWFGTRRLELGARMTVLAFIAIQPLFELAFSLRQPVFLSRTLLWIILGVAVSVGSVLAGRNPTWTKFLAGALLVLQLIGLVGYHMEFRKTAWDQAAAVVAENAGADDVVLVLAGNTVVAFNHYFDTYGLEIPVISIPWRIPDRESSGATLTADDFERIRGLAEEYATTWLVLNSVANIENGSELRPALGQISESVTPHQFTDVRVVAFD